MNNNENKNMDFNLLKISIYDYLKYCQENEVYKKGAGVITDKQSVFYPQISDGTLDHRDIIDKLERSIHPYMENPSIFDGDFSNNIHMTSYGREDFTIDLASNGDLSINQYKLLSNVLDNIEKFNQEYPDNKIEIIMFSPHIIFDEQESIEEKKNKLKNLITKDIVIDKEAIIGDKIDKKDFQSSFLFHTSLHECNNIEKLLNKLKLLSKYYKDENYGDLLINSFPNYMHLYKLLPVFKNCDNLEIDNVNFYNVEQVLADALRISINRYQSFSEIPHSFFQVDTSDFKGDYADLSIFFKLIKSLEEQYMLISLDESAKVDRCFKYSENINEIIEMLAVFRFNNLKSDLINLDNTINYSKNKLEDINIMKKTIENKEQISALYKEKHDIEKNIRKIRLEISIIDETLDYEELDKKSLEDKVLKLTEKIESIKEKYKQIIGSNMPDSFNISDDLTLNENFWIESIKNSQNKKAELENNLKETMKILNILNINDDETFNEIVNKINDEDTILDDSKKVSTVLH